MTDLTIRQQLATDPSGVLADEFSRHWDRLWRIVDFRLNAALAGRVDPDDILQEAWIAAAERVEHFIQKETMSMFVWLRLIVGQTLVDVERRHLGAKMRDAYRERSIHGDHLNRTTSVSLVSRLIGTLTSPSQAAVRQERAAQLRAAIDQMDQLDREVLALRHFEELTNSEVAEMLGIQETAASNRYVRAIRRLKIILDALPGFSEPEK
ncbi:MAG: sigma-70 family RNA polymerase sigma factor [Pirellulales bacterium]|nr:sigma-70 family RNA polymerase sigma factor [Pirellulales bacterium]